MKPDPNPQGRTFHLFLFTLPMLLLATSALAAPRIGVVVPRMQEEFWIKYLAFMERGAEQLGIQLLERDARGEPLGLRGHALGMLDIGVDGLVLTPLGSPQEQEASVALILKAAAEKNVPVVLTLEPLPPALENALRDDNRPCLAWVGPDYMDAGRQAAVAAIEGARPGADGRNNVLALAPAPAAPGAAQRLLGLEKAFKTDSNAKLLDILPHEVWSKKLAEILPQQPEVRSLWCGDGVAALAAQAVASQQKRDLEIVAMDLLPENLYPMNAGHVAYDIGGGWLSGGYALTLLHAHLQGLPAEAIEPVQSYTLLPVTPRTLRRFENDYPDGLPSMDFRKSAEDLGRGVPVINNLRYGY
jgi:ABC-type sugar transport system substrate-binding protein